MSETQMGLFDEDAAASSYLTLAAEALLEGWTREHVIAALLSRIKRDQGYLAYRKACHRRTRYDEQVQQDLRALALAACWLEADGTVRPLPTLAG
ncbi:MAG TPA: hypothetical protein VGP82_23185 [Ktedonobacterales bacterium]|jgi:hypothetical protein|nr:hypothetical protein [Ktedonobacterales bacterium]